MNFGIIDDTVTILEHVLFRMRGRHFQKKFLGYLKALNIGDDLAVVYGR